MFSIKDTKEYEFFHSCNSTQPTFHLHVVWGGGGAEFYMDIKKVNVFMKQLLFHYCDDHHHHYCLHYVALP
jgi:hypothetical protein